MKPETKFQNKVLKDLKTLDRTWVLKTQEKTRKGVPDILICLGGHFVALELKAKEKKPEPLQQFELECIDAALGTALVAYPENWEETFNYLKKILAMQLQSKYKGEV